MHSTQCHCSIQKVIDENNNIIKIINSEKKQIENSKSGSYVVYIITVKGHTTTAKRRYSEFESFRKSLVRLYPTSLIPPIPEKPSITEYAHKQKDDTQLIEKRKRMLERFLNRISVHPVLKREHVFHQFIDGSMTWSEILNSPPLSTLPKDALLSNDFASSITQNLPSTSSSTAATSVIPIPSSSYTLKYPDSTFDESEAKVGKVPQQASISFEKASKRISKKLEDLSNDYSELGSAYNALSLNETGPLSISIEKMGKVIDDSCTRTKEMVNSLEIEFSEYVQEYTQYIYIAQQILRYRYMKQSQLELIQEAIDTKRSLLRSLLRTEEEATKLKASEQDTPQETSRTPIEYDSDSFDTQSLDDGFSAIVKRPELDQDEEDYEESKHQPEQVIYPSGASAQVIRSSKHQSRKWSSPRKLFSAMSVTLQGMIDTDPEQTRRNQIIKIKQVIEQLEQARTSIRQELIDMSKSIQEDFERLEKQKEAELKKILISFAKIHLYYCEQSTASWKDFRNEVSVETNKLK